MWWVLAGRSSGSIKAGEPDQPRPEDLQAFLQEVMSKPSPKRKSEPGGYGKGSGRRQNVSERGERTQRAQSLAQHFCADQMANGRIGSKSGIPECLRQNRMGREELKRRSEQGPGTVLLFWVCFSHAHVHVTCPGRLSEGRFAFVISKELPRGAEAAGLRTTLWGIRDQESTRKCAFSVGAGGGCEPVLVAHGVL